MEVNPGIGSEGADLKHACTGDAERAIREVSVPPLIGTSQGVDPLASRAMDAFGALEYLRAVQYPKSRIASMITPRGVDMRLGEQEGHPQRGNEIP